MTDSDYVELMTGDEPILQVLARIADKTLRDRGREDLREHLRHRGARLEHDAEGFHVFVNDEPVISVRAGSKPGLPDAAWKASSPTIAPSSRNHDLALMLASA